MLSVDAVDLYMYSISMLNEDAVDFYMYIYTLSTELGLHQSRRCVDRCTGGRNLCTGACNHGKSSILLTMHIMYSVYRW